ncbi:MAG: Uma2 family endonuclease [Vicinamibacterales bacterium]|nr:Uma2 family endonuclease [Vicinamibacterales bacterium]
MATARATSSYLSGREEVRRRELVWGRVREPPAPLWDHQAVVMRTAVALDAHVSAGRLGRVSIAPLDVVLDEARALILQPDLVFIAESRMGIVRGQVWGAPDLVVEVQSPYTEARDRTVKLRWYLQYGVREYWLMNPARRRITIVTRAPGGRVRHRAFSGDAPVVSTVLPGLATPASHFFTNGM